MVTVHKTRINLEEIKRAKEIRYMDLDFSKNGGNIFKFRRKRGLWEWKEAFYPHLVEKFALTDEELEECLNDDYYDLRIEVVR